MLILFEPYLIIGFYRVVYYIILIINMKEVIDMSIDSNILRKIYGDVLHKIWNGCEVSLRAEDGMIVCRFIIHDLEFKSDIEESLRNNEDIFLGNKYEVIYDFKHKRTFNYLVQTLVSRDVAMDYLDSIGWSPSLRIEGTDIYLCDKRGTILPGMKVLNNNDKHIAMFATEHNKMKDKNNNLKTSSLFNR